MTSPRFHFTAGVSAVVCVLAMSAVATPAVAGDKDCSDFSSQRQAQKFFKKHGGSKKHDPHRLDADHDGIACESSF